MRVLAFESKGVITVEADGMDTDELALKAIDAGAGFISVNVEGAGKSLVEVADNGCGISVGELPIAVERHATSKLSTAEDLFHVSTLGFRGEALASVRWVKECRTTFLKPRLPAIHFTFFMNFVSSPAGLTSSCGSQWTKTTAASLI
jgi:hypothetical protein